MSYNIVYDESQVKKFAEMILLPCETNEVYFISMSARNKYLAKSDREFYSLGRTEMYGKTIVHSATDFMRKIFRFECNDKGYTTRNGLTIPSSALVCYANINPLSLTKAYTEFTKRVSTKIMESLGGEEPDLSHMVDWFLSQIQNNRGTKNWIDVDIDSTEYDYYAREIIGFLDICRIAYMRIDTKSGAHILIKKEDLTSFNKENPKDKFILHDLVQYLDSTTPEGEEIVINKNDMVPVPGTYQAGFKVSIVKTKD